MGDQNTRIVTRNTISRCPIETGVVRSTNYGTISPGIFIASIAAGLQPQSVQINDFLSHDIMETENFANIELMEMRDSESETRSEKRARLISSLQVIDNQFAAGVSGDLAEVCVFQGPIFGVNTSVGLAGQWNDTLYPRVHLLSTTHQELWEMTDAEILAGLDGLFISQNIQSWVDRLSRLRVSQVFDMYYSGRGIPVTHIDSFNRKRFYSGRRLRPSNSYRESSSKSEKMVQEEGGVESVGWYDGVSNACDRRDILSAIDVAKLKDETYNLAQILQVETPTTIVSDAILRRNCDASVDRFMENASTYNIYSKFKVNNHIKILQEFYWILYHLAIKLVEI